jgi:outer membrane protein TolC
MTSSDRLKAADAEVSRREFDARAAALLGYPQVTLNVIQLAGEKEFATSPLPFIGPIDFTYSFNGPRSSVIMNWPIYTGGRIPAAQAALGAEVDGARAEKRGTEERLDFDLVRRYFGLRLAGQVEALRAEQLALAERQLARARSFELQGQQAKVERLSAQVSRDEAAREFIRARRDREIAEAALAGLLQRPRDAIAPTTPLFVLTAPVQPLEHWLREAESHSPALAVLAAKSAVAAQGITAAEADYLPEVFAFSRYSLIQEYLTPIEPDWIAGVGISFKLFDGTDRASKISAAMAAKTQIDALRSDTRQQIRTSVESAWLRVDQAREQFMLLDSAVELARENLRLRERGLDEGLSTALEVIEARNARTRAETGRAQAAYEFVVALGALLEVSGRIEHFPEFIRRADVRL